MYKKKESLTTLKSHQQILRLISINLPQIHTLGFDSKHWNNHTHECTEYKQWKKMKKTAHDFKEKNIILVF